VVGREKRGVKAGQRRLSTHAREAQECRGERERSIAISAHGFIVRSPLRILCPVPLERGENLEEGDGSWCKKEKQPLQIIARSTMCTLVLQSQVELFRGKRTEHCLRNDQPWTEDADERQERCVPLDNDGFR
jgi:hypothetical protein